MRCPIVDIKRESKDCIEDRCYFWKTDKCSWMST